MTDHPPPQLALRALLDIDAAGDEWGANCGPCALAGALNLQVANVRDAVSVDGRFRGYMTITAMQEALERLGATVDRIWTRPPNGLLAQTDGSSSGCEGPALHLLPPRILRRPRARSRVRRERADRMGHRDGLEDPDPARVDGRSNGPRRYDRESPREPSGRATHDHARFR
jgi:hypothetical protein